MNTFAPLYKIDSKGKKRVFKIEMFSPETGYRTSAGLLDGKLVSRDYYPHPKGKNSTAEQVFKDATSKWNKKLNRELYDLNIDCTTPPAFVKPMLARNYTEVPHQLNWKRGGWTAQRKFNGVRCIAQYEDGNAILTSKKGKRYNNSVIEASLIEQVFSKHPNYKPDCELYLHNVELGDVTHAVAHNDPNLQLQVFDLVNENVHFEGRSNLVFDLALTGSLVYVPHVEIYSEADMIKAHDIYVKQGYEGVMIRNLNDEYEIGIRSASLFKRKTFEESEFEIVDVEQDKDGGAILVLITTSGVRFNSRPMGKNAYRKALWEQRNTILHKMVTVKYSSLLASGAPEFNRTLNKGGHLIRDYE